MALKWVVESLQERQIVERFDAEDLKTVEATDMKDRKKYSKDSN